MVVLSKYLQNLQSKRRCSFMSSDLHSVCSFKPKKLDLQFVKMELYSMEGVLKDTTDCAPNGYYFFVLESKGTFKIEIKGPEGWTFGMSSCCFFPPSFL